MMRGVLLLGNPGNPNDADEYCEGVLKDMEAYSAFFQSFQGGAWNDYEIKTILYPTKDEIKTALKRLSVCEYSIIVFSGHGYVDGRETMLVLSDDGSEVISEYDLRQLNRTVILDCCREPIEVDKQRMVKKGSSLIMDSWNGVNREVARSMYENAIRDCGSQSVVLYGCSIGECAGDISDVGGLYSSELLEVGKRWHGGDILSLASAQKIVKSKLQMLPDVIQTPSIYKSRRLSGSTYPFALSL